MPFCSPCAGCTSTYRPVGGHGPQPAKILCIGERPGGTENHTGIPFSGKTGEEFDGLYLPLAGLARNQVRVCNTVMCGADNNKKPGVKEIAMCAPDHLRWELEHTKPEIVVLMGATACSLVKGIDLKMHHGISRWGYLFGWEGIIIPMYHPSLGLHESRWMKILIDDWTNFGKLSHYKKGIVELHDYKIATANTLRDINIKAGYKLIAIDTESHSGSPWSIQFSSSEGTGYLVRTNDREALPHLQRLVQGAATVVFHNAAYDLEQLRKLGIHVTNFRDTMQEAFHLGNQPQGLKALAYRLFRHNMRSYEDTVRPASVRKLEEWMLEAYDISSRDLVVVDLQELKTKTKEVVKPGNLTSLLKRLIHHTDEQSEYDPWKRLDEYWRDNHRDASHIEARIGPYPRLGIANCMMDEAVEYAVGDADWTLRVAGKLEEIRKGAFQIHECDKDQVEA